MRIIVYCSDFPPLINTGATKTAVNIVNGLIAKGHEVKIISVSSEWIEPDNEKYDIKRIFTEYANVVRDNPLYHFTDQQTEVKFLNTVEEYKPDLVFFMDLQNIPANIIALLKVKKFRTAARFSNLYPLCIKLHRYKYPPCGTARCNGLDNPDECRCCFKDYYKNYNLQFEDENNLTEFILKRRAVLKEIFKSIDLLISPSVYLKEFYEKELGREVRMISTGVEAGRENSVKKRGERLVFSYLGLMDFRKGIHLFLDAADKINSDMCEFRVYGGFSENIPLVPERILKKVKFYGKYVQEDLDSILKETDVAVIPSGFENCSNMVLELLSRKTPLIASDIESMSELVENKKCGILFNINDQNALADSICEIIKNPELIDKFRDNISSFKSVEIFTDCIEKEFMGVCEHVSDCSAADIDTYISALKSISFCSEKKEDEEVLKNPESAGELIRILDSSNVPDKEKSALADKYRYLAELSPQVFYSIIMNLKYPDIKGAVRLLEDFLKKSNLSVNDLYFLGRISIMLRDLNKALVCFERIFKKDFIPSALRVMTHVYCGRVYRFKINNEKSEEHFRRAAELLSINPHRTIALQVLLISLLFDLKSSKETLSESIDELLSMGDKRDILLKTGDLTKYRIASFLRSTSKKDLALIWFKDLMKVTSQNNLKGGAAFHVGEIMYKDHPKEAVKYFTQTVRYIPDHKKAFKYLEENNIDIKVHTVKKEMPQDPDFNESTPQSLISEYNRKVREIVRDLRHPLSPRHVIASRYLKGRGIEVGALHRPTPVDRDTEVIYVDRATLKNHREVRKNLAEEYMVYSDIIDDGEELYSIEDEQYDFIIASHFLEHSADLIKTLKNHLRVIKNRGILLYIIPDKRFSFDKPRQLTEFTHIEEDFIHGWEYNSLSHYREYFSVLHNMNGKELEQKVNHHKGEKIDIHYHVWTSDTFRDHLTEMKEKDYINADILEVFQNNGEFIVVLRKI